MKPQLPKEAGTGKIEDDFHGLRKVVFHVTSSRPCWCRKTKDFSLAPFVRPPSVDIGCKPSIGVSENCSWKVYLCCLYPKLCLLGRNFEFCCLKVISGLTLQGEELIKLHNNQIHCCDTAPSTFEQRVNLPLHGTIFVACDNGLRQAHDMIYDCCVRQKKCRSILKHVLKRCDNRKSCRRPVASLLHATKIVRCKSALRTVVSLSQATKIVPCKSALKLPSNDNFCC